MNIVETLADDLTVITAPNASPMTHTGTRTYLLGRRELAVIDPGPDDAAHLSRILAAVPGGAAISHIFVTHAHRDHSTLAPSLARETGAKIHAFDPTRRAPALDNVGGGEGIDHTFKPDIQLTDDAIVENQDWTLTAMHTPGHIASHLCYVWKQGRAIFTGDHVMGWASTFVSPPDGDMAGYMHSLERLSAQPEKLYFPGHGDPVDDGHARVSQLHAHRLHREAQVLAGLQGGAATVHDLTVAIYHDIPKELLPAASRNVLAHLLDLQERGQVFLTGTNPLHDVFSLKLK